MDERDTARRTWLEENLITYETPALLAGDASSRRYFRLRSKGNSYVLMDAPPSEQSCQAFIAVDHTFQQIGLPVPYIYCFDVKQGFLLLSDFGDKQLLGQLNNQTVDEYYKKACETLLVIQRCRQVTSYELPKFDETLYLSEWNLFCEWYLKRHLNKQLSMTDQQKINYLYHLLIESALSQPQVCVHRDYHSRNLMVLSDNRLGILDFQDAVWGPITYDVMSLLRDCYIEWPYERVKKWVLSFRYRLLEENLLARDDPNQFLLWFDWMSLQRHLKCIGIFSRLYYRDKKTTYLKEIPRIARYIKSICQRHPIFNSLLERCLS